MSGSYLSALVQLEELLRTEAIPRGFIARADASRVRERHIEDCLRAVQEIRPEDRTAYDLGSGAGLPGLVIAIACSDLAVTLVERRRARAAFLELAVAELGITNARVWVGDARELRDRVDLCFARAFAPLARTWGVARPLLLEGGRLIYFAGKTSDPGSLPGARLSEAPQLASGGPLVIMSR